MSLCMCLVPFLYIYPYVYVFTYIYIYLLLVGCRHPSGTPQTTSNPPPPKQTTNRLPITNRLAPLQPVLPLVHRHFASPPRLQPFLLLLVKRHFRLLRPSSGLR